MLAFNASGVSCRGSSSLLSSSRSMPVILPASCGAIASTNGKSRSPNCCFCGSSGVGWGWT